jgi:aspartate 1-decarboxylase
MLIKILKSKLHRGVVTAAQLQYAGSIAIDQALMDAAGIVPYEAVWVADLNNGSRVHTYAVPAAAQSGRIDILGAAAQRIRAGDIVIIMAFAYCTPQEAGQVKPKVIVLDEHNRVVSDSDLRTPVP